MKQCMALSGVFFVMFVLMHSYGNLKILAGPEAYNEYAHHLRTFLTPILPYEGLLWIFRIVMMVLAIVHVFSALYLWHRGGRARGSAYDTKQNILNNYAARTMRWGGVYLLIFVVFHILHFTTKFFKIGNRVNYSSDVMQNIHGHPVPAAPWNMMVTTFSPATWWTLVIYLVAVGCLGMHIAHGVWSALQTMGWLRSNTRRLVVPLSGLIGLAVFTMFAIPPVYLIITQPAPVGI